MGVLVKVGALVMGVLLTLGVGAELGQGTRDAVSGVEWGDK